MSLADLFIPFLLLFALALSGLFLEALSLPGLLLTALGVWAMGAWPGLGMGFAPWSWLTLLKLLGLVAGTEVLQWIMLYVGGRRLKLSRPATLCAMAGGLVGAFMAMPAGPVGAVFGSWLGLVVFTVFWLVAFEAESFLDGLKGGLKALAARLMALGLKAGVLLGLVGWAAFRLYAHLPRH